MPRFFTNYEKTPIYIWLGLSPSDKTRDTLSNGIMTLCNGVTNFIKKFAKGNLTIGELYKQLEILDKPSSCSHMTDFKCLLHQLLGLLKINLKDKNT